MLNTYKHIQHDIQYVYLRVIFLIITNETFLFSCTYYLSVLKKKTQLFGLRLAQIFFQFLFFHLFLDYYDNFTVTKKE